jgi:chaperonin GroES
VSSRSTVGVRASAVDLSKVVPQADRILIRLDLLSEESTGGVLLPRSAVKYERYLVGEVLATGSEVEKIEKGNRVLVSDVNAYEVNLGTSDKICFARASDLLAIVE